MSEAGDSADGVDWAGHLEERIIILPRPPYVTAAPWPMISSRATRPNFVAGALKREARLFQARRNPPSFPFLLQADDADADADTPTSFALWPKPLYPAQPCLASASSSVPPSLGAWPSPATPGAGWWSRDPEHGRCEAKRDLAVTHWPSIQPRPAPSSIAILQLPTFRHIRRPAQQV